MWIRIFVLIIFTAKLATSEHQTISQFDKVYLDQSMNFLETEKNYSSIESNKSEITTELCSYQQLTCLVWPENYGRSHFVFAKFKGRNWKAQHFNKEIFSDIQT